MHFYITMVIFLIHGMTVDENPTAVVTHDKIEARYLLILNSPEKFNFF